MTSLFEVADSPAPAGEARCRVCGRLLTVSAGDGIGPVCLARLHPKAARRHARMVAPARRPVPEAGGQLVLDLAPGGSTAQL